MLPCYIILTSGNLVCEMDESSYRAITQGEADHAILNVTGSTGDFRGQPVTVFTDHIMMLTTIPRDKFKAIQKEDADHGKHRPSTEEELSAMLDNLTKSLKEETHA